LKIARGCSGQAPQEMVCILWIVQPEERACELSWEGWRRNDMIRLGHFTDARVPEKEISLNYRKLYPIPQGELNKNPYLEQNPGY
jgi:hypothetical protein